MTDENLPVPTWPREHFARARKMVGATTTCEQSGNDPRHHFARARTPIRAITTCEQSGNNPTYHIAGAGNMITVGAA